MISLRRFPLFTPSPPIWPPIHLDAGDLASARAVLERVAESVRPNFRLRLHRALLLAKEGKPAEALRVMAPETLKYAEIALFAPANAAEF